MQILARLLPSARTKQQTLSVYFLVFAIGVVVWGRMCDRIGRLLYYLLIGAGLMLAAWGQALGVSLMLCGAFALLLAARIDEKDI